MVLSQSIYDESLDRYHPPRDGDDHGLLVPVLQEEVLSSRLIALRVREE